MGDCEQYITLSITSIERSGCKPEVLETWTSDLVVRGKAARGIYLDSGAKLGGGENVNVFVNPSIIPVT